MVNISAYAVLPTSPHRPHVVILCFAVELMAVLISHN